MGVPSPTIPTFTDGSLLHATALNALASNLTNLYNYNQGGFSTQRPCVIAVQTTGQSIPNSSDTLVNFNSAPVNTNNMWVASQPTQITIQTAGIYYLFGAIHYPLLGSPTLATDATAELRLNGTGPGNAVMGADLPYVSNGAGTIPQTSYLANLASGAVLYLNAWHTAGASETLIASPYGSTLAAIFLTSST